MSHIFGIGLQRTGTTSLAKAIELLGYSASHDDAICWALYRSIMASETPEIPTDFICEYPFCLIAPLLDVRYPGSKFILTTRDLQSWMVSMLKLHSVIYAHSPNMAPEFTSIGSLKNMHQTFQNINLQYFRDRNDCLIIRTEDLAWEPLCEFLGKPIPEAPFPTLNRLN